MAGGSIEEGSQCEPTFLGVRIVQEQQAHSSFGRSERSSLMMISIIQAICANRHSVFIHLLKSTRLAAQSALPTVLFLLICAAFCPPTLCKDDCCDLCCSLYLVSMIWSQSAEMGNIDEVDIMLPYLPWFSKCSCAAKYKIRYYSQRKFVQIYQTK